MTKIALMGSSGKMGQELKQLILLRPKELRLVERDQSADVLIDFSSPEGLLDAIKWSVKNKTPLVSGTTGIGPKEERALKAAAQKIAVFWTSNFSMGIALVSIMLKHFQEAEDFDFQIEEFHHRHKKDRPSGTAKTLQKELQKYVHQKLPEPVAIRGGEIFGIHKVWAMSSSENILIEHTALNRSVFAKGALKAALWLTQQAPGNYTMRDLL